MKVEIRYSEGKEEEGDELQASCTVRVDGKEVAAGYNFSECPEDANLGRDLRFVYGIPEALRKAHAAGAAGEPFELVETEDWGY